VKWSFSGLSLLKTSSALQTLDNREATGITACTSLIPSVLAWWGARSNTIILSTRSKFASDFLCIELDKMPFHLSGPKMRFSSFKGVGTGGFEVALAYQTNAYPAVYAT
jgi:hypothetical protein